MPTQDQLHAEYYEAKSRYFDLPSAPPEGSEADLRLKAAEEALLDNPPDGQGKGLIAQSYAPSPETITFGQSGIVLVPEKDWPDAIAQQKVARARPNDHVWITLNQGQVGSCAAESKDGTMMVVREIGNQKRIQFNPLATYGRVNGGSDRGSSLQDNIQFAQTYGCFPESVWPRSNGWRAKPSDEAYDAAKAFRLLEVVEITSKAEFVSAVLDSHPVYFGYDSHAVFAVEILDGNRCVFQNSWGDWGENGRGTLSFSSIVWGFGAYAILAPTWAGGEHD